MTPEQEKLLIEVLADIEHQRWADWQKHLHEISDKNDDGSIRLNPLDVQRWEMQINTHYNNLSEEEKESDREQVKRYLNIIKLLIK
jgi:hypothetical protein